MSRYESRLIKPWEEERDRLPNVVKTILALIGVAVVLGSLLNQCPMQEAQAEEYGTINAYWSSDAQRREVQALESIADSLKKIERKMK